MTGNQLYLTACEIVRAPVERFPRLCKIAEVFLDDILKKLVNVSAFALRGEVFELLFRLGGEVYFHAFQVTRNAKRRNRVIGLEDNMASLDEARKYDSSQIEKAGFSYSRPFLFISPANLALTSGHSDATIENRAEFRGV